MYKVFTARQERMEGQIKPLRYFKGFKSKKAALKCAYERNQMITTQTLGIEYLVYDSVENCVLQSVAA